MHYKHIILLISLTYLFINILQAQQTVTIRGDAPFAKNEEIRLIAFNDLINNEPTILTTDNIDNKGRFKLTCPLQQIQLVQLAIRNAKAELFIVPENEYNLHIDVDTILFNLIDPEKYGGFLQITTDKIDTNDLNYKINRFSRFFEQSLNQYAFALTVDKNKAAFDTLTQLLHKYFPIRYNPLNFYESYLYYSYGLLDQLFYEKYPERLYKKYFDNDYILYSNPAYMALFNDSYSGYLYNSRYISKDLLTKTINEQPDYLTLFNEVGRDPMLSNERLRELVIIKNLCEFYDNEEFDKQNILNLLTYIKEYTHFPEHATIVAHALNKLKNTVLSAATLTMTDIKGKQVNFNQFDGKPVYVQVFQSDCIDCIREMTLIKEFNKLYGNNIQFISLNLDADANQYKAFCKKYGELFNWPILYFGRSYDWITALGIETLPDYFIVDSNGDMLVRDAPAPEQGLSEYLYFHYPKIEEEQENPMFKERK